jgi:phosphohistidine phosphatase
MSAHRVYLVRHAKAEPGGPSMQDAARRLTVEGRRRFNLLLGALGGRLSARRIVSSPLVRARQTAELLASATGATIAEDERLASGVSGGPELLALVREAAADTALVGHNPEIAEAVARVAGKDLEVKPGAVAALDVEGKDVRLAWLQAPEPG